MSHAILRTAPAVLLAAVVTTLAVAHVEDPKARDLLPPVYAPAFRASEGGGVAETFESSGVLLRSWLPLNVFPGSPTSANDCWGYHSASGREYAIIGLSNGTGFVDITDPGNAQIVGHITGPTSLWRCVKTYGNYCYAGSEGGNGIQVIDLSNIDGTNAALPRVSLVREVTTGGTTATHTIYVDTANGFLYRAGGGSNGLRIYNVRNDPSNPTLVGQWNNVYVHEVQVFAYTTGPYAGKQIAFCCGGASGGYTNTGMYIVDVTDKAAPVQLSYTTYPNAKFCHQSWLSNDLQRIYINDELDEGATVTTTTTIVMNVANLAAPFVEGTFNNGNTAIGHNLYIRGDNLFEANYRSGIRVFNLAASAGNPPEVAYFDTWPGDNLPQYNGLWNVWPWFNSGTFIGSDINRGLFVWRLGQAPGVFGYPNGRPTFVPPSGAQLLVTIAMNPGQTLEPDAARMRLTVGADVSIIPLEDIGDGTYRATFPAMACGTAFSYSFEFNVNGDVYPDPAGAVSAVAAIGQMVSLDDACEADAGWTLGVATDTATTGKWVCADPVGTAAQPEDDHSATGTKCFVTGNSAVGGGVGDADIDGGATTLISPVFSATGADVYVSYWRWYSNNQGSAPGEDSMPISISNNGGATWTQLELVTENAGAWVSKAFRVADFVTPTTNMRLKFEARDLNSGSVVEAAIDDVRVFGYVCSPSMSADLNNDQLVNGTDLGVLLGSWGQPGATDLNGDGTTDGLDLGILLGQWTG